MVIHIFSTIIYALRILEIHEKCGEEPRQWGSGPSAVLFCYYLFLLCFFEYAKNSFFLCITSPLQL